jgi:hypothetical protein
MSRDNMKSTTHASVKLRRVPVLIVDQTVDLPAVLVSIDTGLLSPDCAD